jgi:nitronate monooxygenase
MIETRITSRLGLSHPVACAPMSLHSGGRLAGAVSRAGGLGLFGALTLEGPDWLRAQIRIARELSGDRPFGIGFITHLIPVFPELVDVAIEERVPVIAFSFADPAPWVARFKEQGATILCQVQSVESAAEAVAAGADVLVAQGNEAGGHTGRANLMPLLSRLLADHPEIPVLAAGGIATGRALAAVLAAGADGAWLGTPFLATPECEQVGDAYKRALVEARSEDTVYTEVFDVLDVAAFGIPPWPQGIAGRSIANDLVREWHGREEALRAQVDDLLPAYRQAVERSDVTRTALWAGESVDFVTRVRPAGEVLVEISEEAEAILRH